MKFDGLFTRLSSLEGKTLLCQANRKNEKYHLKQQFITVFVDIRKGICQFKVIGIMNHPTNGTKNNISNGELK